MSGATYIKATNKFNREAMSLQQYNIIFALRLYYLI